MPTQKLRRTHMMNSQQLQTVLLIPKETATEGLLGATLVAARVREFLQQAHPNLLESQGLR